MKTHGATCFLLATFWMLSVANSGNAEPPEPFDPDLMAPEGSLPGTYPESVTAANVNISPSPGSVLDGNNSNNLRVTFPAAGPVRWTESRHNEGDVALLIGPFNPDDASYYPPNTFVNDYKPLADGQAFADTTLAWRVSRDSGALLATVRHNGVNQQDSVGGSQLGIKHGVAYFNADFGQGWGFRMDDGLFSNGGSASADLQMGVAGNDGGAGEASFDVATAFFPYEQGWLGAWVAAPADEGDATFSHGNPELDAETVQWYAVDGEDVFAGAFARVDLPDIDSANDGMLFVAPTNGDNSTNIAAGTPNDGGWIVAVREDNNADLSGQTVADMPESEFQFLYVPYSAGGLIGGQVSGVDGSLVNSAGDSRFSLARRSAGEYALSVLTTDGQSKLSEDDGMLILSVAGSIGDDPVLADRAFLSYEFEPATGDFIIQSRELIERNNPAQSENVFGDVLALEDTDFYFAFVDFQAPLTPEPGSSVPGDYDGDGQLTAADLDLQASEGIAMQILTYDLNGDGVVDHDGDRVMWLHDLKKAPVGDADLNGSFTSNDFVQVFIAGLYETESAAKWEEGDWNGDLVFDSNDFVAAFIDGYYEQGAFPGNNAVAAVPEPSCAVLAVLGVASLVGLRRRRD